MQKSTIFLAATMALGLTIPPTQSHAAANGAAHMKITGRTSQPIGHYEYCKQYKRDCRIRSSDTRAVKLTKSRWKELDRINYHSNSTVRPVTDMEIYKVEEHWTYPNRYGDCEDYVLMKRHMLMKAGWPASSLLVTVVRQPNGDGHAVLTVRTDRADYVLDNLTNKIKPWNDTEYTYLKRQSSRHSGHWVNIEDNRTQIVGSVKR